MHMVMKTDNAIIKVE